MTKNITISRLLIKKEEGVVIVPLKRWEKIEKEHKELQLAVEAILAGEIALRKKQTRPFSVFLESEFPEYAKDL